MRAVLTLTLLAFACGGSDPKDETTTPSAGDMAAAAAAAPKASPAASPGEVEPAATPEQTVFFAHDSHALDDAARQALGDDVAWMQENPDRHLVIHGYASEPGTPTHNLTLGNNRANAIREYLVAQGIDIGRISVVSHGEEGPELPAQVERRAVFVAEQNP